MCYHYEEECVLPVEDEEDESKYKLLPPFEKHVE
jgi:hypothetical protein